MAKKEDKTNAMRILEKEGIAFEYQTYECKEFEDGIHVADQIGLPHELVFKTLVTVGADHNYYVFVLPIAKELDFKKCARSVGVKSVEMIPVKDINKVTGYIRGGTTSIGMKKRYITRIASEAENLEQIYISGGRIGMQIKLSPIDLAMVTGAEFADVTR